VLTLRFIADTDSIFVKLEGRTWQEAVEIGHEIAKEVTKRHPKPMRLKFEKVYHPCILASKKRYVGHMYETKQQKQPIFDDKGT
jgi:DNA polymerase zeta